VAGTDGIVSHRPIAVAVALLRAARARENEPR